MIRPCLVPAAFALGGDQRALAQAAERMSHDLLGVAQAVDRRGVNPIDAQFQGTVNGADGFRVILRSPTELPIAAAHGPSAKADRGQPQAGVPELSGWQHSDSNSILEPNRVAGLGTPPSLNP